MLVPDRRPSTPARGPGAERRPVPARTILLVVVLGLVATWSLARPAAGVAAPAAQPDGTPSKLAPDGHLRGPRVVAPGGRVDAFVSGVPLPAKVQELVGRRWIDRGKRVGTEGGAARFRAPRGEGRIALRVLDATGVGSKALRIQVRALRMAAVGDINLSPAPLGSIAGGDVDAPWASVGPRLRAADLTFGNLETAVSTRGTPQEKQFRFRSSPASIGAMVRDSGMDVVNLANNHVGDYGHLATLDTLRYVEQYGMTYTGAGKDAAEAYRPRVVRRLGLRIAFVGFSNVLPSEFAATASRPGTAWASAKAVRSSVRRAAKEADVVIATFHWGIELAKRPRASDAALARLAIRSGATAVIGGHPHVLQPTVRIGKHRLIAYSLGNFVFPSHSAGTTSTGILRLGLGAGTVLSHAFDRATIHGATPVLDGR